MIAAKTSPGEFSASDLADHHVAEVIVPLPAHHLAPQGSRIAQSQQVQPRELAGAVRRKVLAGHLPFPLPRSVHVQSQSPRRLEGRRRVAGEIQVGHQPEFRQQFGFLRRGLCPGLDVRRVPSEIVVQRAVKGVRQLPSAARAEHVEHVRVRRRHVLGQLGIEHLLGDAQRLRSLPFIHVDQRHLPAQQLDAGRRHRFGGNVTCPRLVGQGADPRMAISRGTVDEHRVMDKAGRVGRNGVASPLAAVDGHRQPLRDDLQVE